MRKCFSSLLTRGLALYLWTRSVEGWLPRCSHHFKTSFLKKLDAADLTRMLSLVWGRREGTGFAKRSVPQAAKMLHTHWAHTQARVQISRVWWQEYKAVCLLKSVERRLIPKPDAADIRKIENVYQITATRIYIVIQVLGKCRDTCHIMCSLKTSYIKSCPRYHSTVPMISYTYDIEVSAL